MAGYKLPWSYNVLSLPFHAGNRYLYLPFSMYIGHRGYRPLAGGFGGAGNILQQFAPLVQSLFGGNIKTSAADSGPSEAESAGESASTSAKANENLSKEELQKFVDRELGKPLSTFPGVIVNPFATHPILTGALIGGLLGGAYLSGKYKKRYKTLRERVFSPEAAFGFLSGAMAGGGAGLILDQLGKLVADK